MYRSARMLPALFAALVLGVLSVGLTVVGAAPATATPNPSGFVRVAHLAPDVGPVSVTLAPADELSQLLTDEAPYGAVSDYRTVAPGEYTVAVRPVATPATDPPLLAAQITVEPGQAYTVLVTGEPGELVTRVIDDELTPPAAGQAGVRLVQGSPSASTLTVATVDGPVLARNVAYGSATGYGDVPAGRWTLSASTRDGATVELEEPVVDLPAGRVVSLVVTDAPDGGFTVTTVVDAQGVDRELVPTGGVEAGGGGAGAAPSRWWPMVGVSTAGVALVLGVAGLRTRRRV